MTETENPQYKALLLGGGAREHMIAESLCENGLINLLAISPSLNPGINRLASDYILHSDSDVDWIREFTEKNGVDFAISGGEGPLVAGIVDELKEIGVETVGPVVDAARIEGSKKYLRELMMKYDIPASVESHFITDLSEAEKLLATGKDFALKPIGLTGGKGVRVMGVQLESPEATLAYTSDVLSQEIGGESAILFEERLIGEEFTLQTFVDAETDSVVPMPLVKDYKLAEEGEKGSNTGSMGSYTQEDGLLPFVDEEELGFSLDVMKQIVSALKKEGHIYKGVLYGQFMKTDEGIKLIETNCRFGDPEGINVLNLLETDFVEICRAILEGRLNDIEINFKKAATVIKYITPPGYPDNPQEGSVLDIDETAVQKAGVKVLYANVVKKEGQFVMGKARAIALLGEGETVEEAGKAVEDILGYISGDYHLRHDIGTHGLTYR